MSRFQLWIMGWINIAAGIMIILSLGHWNPSWELNWCIRCALRESNRAGKLDGDQGPKV